MAFTHKLCARKLESHIHRKGKTGKPLTEQAKGSNRTKSLVRMRVEVEHVFGAQANAMGGTLAASAAAATRPPPGISSDRRLPEMAALHHRTMLWPQTYPSAVATG